MFNFSNRYNNFSSSVTGVSRSQAFARSGGRINAGLQNPEIDATGMTDTANAPLWGPFLWFFNPIYWGDGQHGFNSQHPSGVNFRFGAGSVRFLTQSINMTVSQAASTGALSEPISADQL